LSSSIKGSVSGAVSSGFISAFSSVDTIIGISTWSILIASSSSLASSLVLDLDDLMLADFLDETDDDLELVFFFLVLDEATPFTLAVRLILSGPLGFKFLPLAGTGIFFLATYAEVMTPFSALAL
jgi:hypothetical protein